MSSKRPLKWPLWCRCFCRYKPNIFNNMSQSAFINLPINGRLNGRFDGGINGVIKA